jgi:hypothetical protein
MQTALDIEEYERRKQFCEVIKGLSRPEYIEVARILRKNNVSFSENRNGMYFDLSKLPQDVFEELVQFHSFLNKSAVELTSRT